MADTTALPVFAYTDASTQLEELRDYLNKQGAKLDGKGPEDLPENLLQLCSHVCLLGQVGTEADMILSSISSLFISIPENRAYNVVSTLCQQLSVQNFKGIGWASPAGAAVRVLSNLFHGFARHPKIQEKIFIALLELCGESRLIRELDPARPEKLPEYFAFWKTNIAGRRDILRKLHTSLLLDHRADQAAKVMISLLESYTDADASSAIEDARECVRTAVVDPQSLSFDHVARLPAVRLLQQSDPLMHNALEIFTTGNLKDYKAFVKKNPDFVASKLRVSEEILTKKMRLLTLMSMAEKKNVIPMPLLSSELDIPEENEDLEEFIIGAIQVNAISGKVNDLTRELVVTSFQHRSFGREQWQNLHHRLKSLIASIKVSHENIKSVNVMTTLVN